ncbi:haloacid dehalogenase [Lamprobacter modestohalophilus]|uniref:Haloacid dehalogenase n=1 Tax=Lamprobacter modestohalophilus TaxID=1064514 RepID=A0A9X0WBB3_9GAMM|nr:HAD-IIA family hydrolase [Lamprobacter modestohalophilus]MBK1620030.1 haloacid dehalogenase [Lamprobacter modestohalophilus]
MPVKLFADNKRPIQALLLDMDGVLYHGNSLLAGATALLQRIKTTRHLFLTNNPRRTPEAVADRLEAMGLPRPDPTQILTSALATAEHLARLKPGFSWYAIGEDGLETALLAAGGRLDAQQADFVIVGEGPGIDFDCLTIAINLVLKQGARLVVTNPDASVDDQHEGEHRVLPGGGALVAPIAIACEVEPWVIGKPQPALFEMACARLDVEPADCLMIGDRPDTDIAGALAIGMRAALVRTGRFGPDASWPAGLPRPHWDAPDLPHLLQAIEPWLP